MADTINKKIEVLLSIKGQVAGDLKKIANVSGLKQFAESLERLSKIGKIPALSKVTEDLKKLDGIKVPQLRQLAVGLEKIAGFKGKFPEFGKLATELKRLDGIKSPQILQIATGLEKITQVKIGDVGAKIRILERNLKHLTSGNNIPKIGALADGLAKLNKVDLSESTAKLKRLDKVLQDLFRDLARLPAIGALATGLKKLQEIDIGPAVAKLRQLNDALRKLPGGGAFLAGLSNVSKSIERLGGDFTKLDSKVKQTTVTFGTFGQVIVKYLRYRVIASSVMFLSQAFSDGLTAIADYDQALKNLQAITGATELEVEKMGAVMRDVADTTKFSVTEIGQSMVLLGQAGLSAGESIASIPHIAALAAGTLTDLTTTADLVTTSLRVFSIAAQDTQEVVDTFANAVNGSKLTINKLATSMNFVGPIAHEVGLSIQEASAAMMTLANSGLRASTIGTSLRRILIELAAPSDKLAEASARAGVSLNSLNTSTNSMESVLGNLKAIIGSAGDTFAQAGLAAELFGKRGAAGTLALLKQAEDGTFIFANMLDISNRVGTAQRMQDIQLKGLATSWKNLKDKIELLIVAMGRSGLIGIFRTLIDLMKGVTDALTALVNNGVIPFIAQVIVATTAIYALGAAFAYLKTQATLGALTKVAQVMGTTGAASVGAAAGVGFLTKAFAGLRAILISLKLAFLANPWFWAAAGVATLVVGVIKLVSWLKKSKSAISESATELAKTTEKWRQAGEQIAKYQSRIVELQGQDTTTIEGQRKHRELVSDLIQVYPEYAKEIIAASGSLDGLNTALVEVGKSIRLKELESSRKESILFSEAIAEQEKRLIELRKAQDKLLEPDPDKRDTKAIADIEKEIQDASRTIDNSIAMIAYTIQQFQREGIQVEWEEILGAETAKQAFAFVDEIAQKGTAKINESLSGIGATTAKEFKIGFKAAMEERDTVHKKALYDITLREAEGVLDQQQADREREISTEQHYKTRLSLAQQYFADVAGVQGQGPSSDEYRKAYKEVEDATQELYAKSLSSLQQHTDKRRDLQEKDFEREKDFSEKTETLKRELNEKLADYGEKRTEIEQKSAAAILSIEDSTSNDVYALRVRNLTKLEKAELAHNEKLRGYDERRKSLDKRTRETTADIERSIADDIFRIRQKGLSESKKEAQNEKRARDKRVEGINQVRDALQSSDESALERGKDLLQQSKTLYSALSDSNKAVRGLNKIQDALIEAEEVSKQFKIADLNKDIADTKSLYQFKLDKAQEIHDDALAKSKKEYDYQESRLEEIKRLAKSIKFDLSSGSSSIIVPGFADGGSADFKRPSSPYVTKGTGNRDDVPSLLKKTEFIMRGEAVKKWGLGFMYALNNGIFNPLLAGIQSFNVGGFVGSVPSSAIAAGSQSNDVLDINLNLPTQGPSIPIRIDRSFVSEFLRQAQSMGRTAL